MLVELDVTDDRQDRGRVHVRVRVRVMTSASTGCRDRWWFTGSRVMEAAVLVLVLALVLVRPSGRLVAEIVAHQLFVGRMESEARRHIQRTRHRHKRSGKIVFNVAAIRPDS